MNPKFLLCLVGGTACSIAAAIYFSPDISAELSDEPPAGLPIRSEPSRDRSIPSPVAVNSRPALPNEATGSASSTPSTHSFPQRAAGVSRPSRPQMTSLPGSARSSTTATPRTAAPQFSTSAPPAAAASDEGLLVPLGASLPAPLVDSGEGATPAQVNMLDRISDDFVRRVEAEEGSENARLSDKRSNTGNPTQRPANWDAATREADERYRQLFGVEAYNARTSAAAREGLQELKAANGR